MFQDQPDTIKDMPVAKDHVFLPSRILVSNQLHKNEMIGTGYFREDEDGVHAKKCLLTQLTDNSLSVRTFNKQ